MAGHSDLSRLLTVVPYLRSHPQVTATQAAKDLGVTERQLEGDLRTLLMSGFTVGGLDDDLHLERDGQEPAIISMGSPDELDRPMKLSSAEAWSLIAALQIVRDLADESLARTVDRVIDKLVEAGSVDHDAVRVHPPEIDEKSQWYMQACERGWRIKLTHRRESAGALTTHVVDPVEVQLRDGHLYLHGWSLTRKAWRTWRLDRIVDAVRIGSATRHRHSDDEWFAALPADAEVQVIVRPAARWLGEHFPSRRVERVEQGWQITFPVANDAWFTGLLAMFQDEVLAVTPACAAHRLAELATRTLAAHRVCSVDGEG